jgi:hypothetical protein
LQGLEKSSDSAATVDLIDAAEGCSGIFNFLMGEGRKVYDDREICCLDSKRDCFHRGGDYWVGILWGQWGY